MRNANQAKTEAKRRVAGAAQLEQSLETSTIEKEKLFQDITALHSQLDKQKHDLDRLEADKKRLDDQIEQLAVEQKTDVEKVRVLQ